MTEGKKTDEIFLLFLVDEEADNKEMDAAELLDYATISPRNSKAEPLLYGAIWLLLSYVISILRNYQPAG